MQALIFDCDGVLVDTERDGHRVSFNRAFAGLGIDAEWSVDRYGTLLTTAGGKERMARHFKETGWPAAFADHDALIAQLHKRKTDLFMELIAAGDLPLRPGVKRLVDEAIAAKIKLAVCSTSNERAVQALVDVMLGPARAAQISVFAGDVVPAKKPDPAIYLLAARTLGLDPSQCVVVEDSHIGLTAAKAAGMSCIVTKSSYTAEEDFSQADRVVPDLDAGITLATCRSLAARRVA
ncbi:HAD family hydrolase [Dongia sedimenti]|uniref:HAD family hydrolase n=1 Tax=Dongia sedimenti TaxID=3064282 RepID=A0ABU0YTQ1_9PROT|nr:HAD family hydrolase [Rhodospirillaceae bacterium R-7]